MVDSTATGGNAAQTAAQSPTPGGNALDSTERRTAALGASPASAVIDARPSCSFGAEEHARIVPEAAARAPPLSEQIPTWEPGTELPAGGDRAARLRHRSAIRAPSDRLSHQRNLEAAAGTLIAQAGMTTAAAAEAEPDQDAGDARGSDNDSNGPGASSDTAEQLRSPNGLRCRSSSTVYRSPKRRNLPHPDQALMAPAVEDFDVLWHHLDSVNLCNCAVAGARARAQQRRTTQARTRGAGGTNGPGR
jgi:hypothetical protein